jgi:hypothetical protein
MSEGSPSGVETVAAKPAAAEGGPINSEDDVRPDVVVEQAIEVVDDGDEVPDHDSLVPVTGSLAGDEGVGEEEEGEEEDEDDYSNVVQGTTETLLTKLEENLASGGGGSTATTVTLQDCEPADMEEEGKDIEQVLSIISNSIYRWGIRCFCMGDTMVY